MKATLLSSSSEQFERMSTELEHIKGVYSRAQGNSTIYDLLLSSENLSFISATKGTFEAHLTLSSCHVNSRGTIHGAVSAAIVDWAGGISIATHGYEKTGASIDIHISYLNTAMVGDVLQIKGVAEKLGGNISFTRITISKIINSVPGPIVAMGTHSKYFPLPR